MISDYCQLSPFLLATPHSELKQIFRDNLRLHTYIGYVSMCNKAFNLLKDINYSPLVWLRGLGVVPQTEGLHFSQLGDISGLRTRSLVGDVQEATDRCLSHTLMFVSLSFSLPLPFSLKDKNDRNYFMNNVFTASFPLVFSICVKKIKRNNSTKY